MVNRRFSILFLLGALVASGCGEAASEGSAVHVKFSVFRDGVNMACGDVADIKKTEVSVRSAGGIAEVPGFPKEVSCAAAVFELSLKDGEYVLEITAFDQAGLGLYQARRNIEVASGANLEFSLEPQKARLKLDWSFVAMGERSPCTDQVNEIDVTISASGSSGDAFNAQFKCDAGPVWIERYFSPRTYTVLVLGISPNDYTVFKTRETRVLERGENEYHSILNPVGGRLMMQWQFKLPQGGHIPDCNDPEVGLDQIELSVRTDLGDEPIQETLACAQNGSYSLNTKRFSQGSLLHFELIGDGVHRYRYFESFIMPDGDKNFGLLTLEPVGDANLLWTTTATSGCNNQTNFSYDITITNEDSGRKAVEVELGQSQSNYAVRDLAFGDYEVKIVGKNAQDTFCQVSGSRAINIGGDNAWAAFQL